MNPFNTNYQNRQNQVSYQSQNNSNFQQQNNYQNRQNTSPNNTVRYTTTQNHNQNQTPHNPTRTIIPISTPNSQTQPDNQNQALVIQKDEGFDWTGMQLGVEEITTGNVACVSQKMDLDEPVSVEEDLMTEKMSKVKIEELSEESDVCVEKKLGLILDSVTEIPEQCD